MIQRWNLCRRMTKTMLSIWMQTSRDRRVPIDIGEDVAAGQDQGSAEIDGVARGVVVEVGVDHQGTGVEVIEKKRRSEKMSGNAEEKDCRISKRSI